MLLGDRMKEMTGNAGAATSNAAVAGVWTAYWEWVNKEFSKQLKSLRDETNTLQKVRV
jgi:cullin-associated NEDD8-dissociated protein 1